MADAAAADIAARTGAAVEPEPFTTTLRGVLLTERCARFLRHDGEATDVAEGALWWPPAKIAGRELAGYLAGLDEEAGRRSGLRVDGARRNRRRRSAGPAMTAPEVVVAGGGVAALEFALALRAHVGEAIDITLVAPDPDFELRHLLVAEPLGAVTQVRRPLSELAADIGFRLVPAKVSCRRARTPPRDPPQRRRPALRHARPRARRADRCPPSTMPCTSATRRARSGSRPCTRRSATASCAASRSWRPPRPAGCCRSTRPRC